MIKKIKLYGPLKKISGVEEFQADVSNVDQVYSFIKINYPDLYVAQKPTPAPAPKKTVAKAKVEKKDGK